MNGGWQFTADSFSVTNLTVQQMLFNAYDLKMDGQLIGLPKWGDTDRWDIQAKIGDEAQQAMHKLNRLQYTNEIQLMLQNLLVQRFQLKSHSETRELPIYDLTIAKNGLKLKAAASENPVKWSAGWSMGSGKFTGKEVDFASLAKALSSCDDVSRIVVDKTGLTEKYDVHLKWTPDGQQETADSGPSIFTALEEQLGLKLVPAKGPVDVIVVDHIELPSEN